MKELYVTVYTKEYGKQQLNILEWCEYHTYTKTFHRIGGAALVWANGNLGYYIEGTRYKEGEYWDLINSYKSLPKSIKRCHKYKWVREL